RGLPTAAAAIPVRKPRMRPTALSGLQASPGDGGSAPVARVSEAHPGPPSTTIARRGGKPGCGIHPCPGYAAPDPFSLANEQIAGPALSAPVARVSEAHPGIAIRYRSYTNATAPDAACGLIRATGFAERRWQRTCSPGKRSAPGIAIAEDRAPWRKPGCGLRPYPGYAPNSESSPR